MRHRDPRLFYLSMEVSVRRAGVKTILVLDDDTRPAILQACHPKGESRFCLQLRPGGLIRVHTSALQPTSQYKSLVISEETTSDELLQLLLSCYNSIEPVEQFSIYEVCPGQEYQRKLHPDDIPLRAQAERMKRGEICHFLVRRNPNYARRRQLLASLNDVGLPDAYGSPKGSNKSYDANSTISSLEDSASLLDISIESLPDDFSSLMASDEDDDCNSSSSSGSSSTKSNSSTECSSNASISPPSTALCVRRTPSNISSILAINDICVNCRNSFKSCEFCQKNSALMQLQRQRAVGTTTMTTTTAPVGTATSANKLKSPQMSTYNPVYNIREIRTATHSFSSLGNDKKLLDIQLNGRFDASTCRMRPQSVYVGGSSAQRMLLDAVPALKSTPASVATNDINGNIVTPKKTAAASATSPTTSATPNATGGTEAVNNNPSKGLGHFVYL